MLLPQFRAPQRRAPSPQPEGPLCGCFQFLQPIPPQPIPPQPGGRPCGTLPSFSIDYNRYFSFIPSRMQVVVLKQEGPRKRNGNFATVYTLIRSSTIYI